MHEIKNIDPSSLENFLEVERRDCQYFWYAGRLRRPRFEGFNSNGIQMWKSERPKVLFYKIFEIFEIKYTMSGRWNGQTKSEFDKNFKRVSDIVAKSDGDKEKAIKLAKQQTAKITDEWKAINRALVAKQAGHEYIFEVFFQRAYELGTVTKQEYREYKLEKLGI
jgi:hypothetical protein